MRIYFLAFCAGVVALRFIPVLPAPHWLLLLLLCALLLLRKLGWLAVFLLAFCWASWQVTLVLNDRLVDEWDGQTVWLEGQVAGLPQWSQSATGQPVVRFELLDAQSRRTELPSRIRVSWYNPPLIKAGEYWRLAVTLKQPHGLLNPHTFDYQQWLTSRAIGATGSVKTGERVRAGRGLAAWREALRDRLLLALPDTPARAGVIALVLGDGSGLSRAQWQVLQSSGTVHLFVISGQHISLVAGLAYALIAWLQRLALWPMRVPWLPVACGLALLSALLYGALAGFAVPVQRALIMVAVVLFWRLRYQQLASWTPWLLALSLILFYDPLVVLQPGLWLSFAAVAVLLLVFAWRLGRWPWWQVLTRAQWAAALGLMPFLLALGLPVSALGVIANIVAVPFVSVWALPLSLLGAGLLFWPAAAQFVLWLAAQSLTLMWHVLELGVSWLAAWNAPFLPWWVLLLAALAVFLLLLPSALRPAWLVLGLFIPLLWPPLTHEVRPNRAQIWLLDVGQGQAIVVRTATHTLLYDAGPKMGGMDAGEQIVWPFLRGERIKQLDKLVLSHADADHAGGAEAVLQRLPVLQRISGEPERHQHWQAQPCSEQSWQWDGVRFWQWQWSQATEGNEASCVLLVQAQDERFLVTGDLGVIGERALLDAQPDLQVDWLVAGHHGSRTSTSAEFLQHLQPSAVLISRGRYNGYGHPHAVVMQRLQQAQVKIYDTASDKAMRIDLGAHQKIWRMAQQRAFWRDGVQE